MFMDVTMDANGDHELFALLIVCITNSNIIRDREK